MNLHWYYDGKDTEPVHILVHAAIILVPTVTLNSAFTFQKDEVQGNDTERQKRRDTEQ